jgi:hypothetical protein
VRGRGCLARVHLAGASELNSAPGARLADRQGRDSDVAHSAAPAVRRIFKVLEGLRCGPDFDTQDRMIRFTDPATSESPSGPLPTNQRSLEDLTPAHVAAIMRSIDEASIDAPRLRGLPQGLHLELID